MYINYWEILFSIQQFNKWTITITLFTQYILGIIKFLNFITKVLLVIVGVIIIIFLFFVVFFYWKKKTKKNNVYNVYITDLH